MAFICNHCPYVKAVENRLIQLASEMKLKGIEFLGICSNDFEEYPEDSPQELRKRWEEKKYGFEYLIDEDQSVARAFGAVCTPDFFVYFRGKLFYRGRLDDSWQDEEKVQEPSLRQALYRLLENQKPPLRSKKPSMGCSIKWKRA